MKIAFVALPRQQDTQLTRIAPPLPLAYIAALLEQRRHIVRIYDLALQAEQSAKQLELLRTFRPHLVVVASSDAQYADAVEGALHGLNTKIVRLHTSLRDPLPGQAAAQALLRTDEAGIVKDEQNVIYDALLALNNDLDALPFPARHLLALEQYPLLTLAGDLQTTMVVGQHLTTTTVVPRQPALVVAEMQSIAREHGIRHVVFASPSITHDLVWLQTFLEHLIAADVGVRWEAIANYERIDAALMALCKSAGCEVLCFEFAADDVLLSRDARTELASVVQLAHDSGIAVRARIELDPVLGAMPMLIDISATFALDDVQFIVRPTAETNLAAVPTDALVPDDVAEMARSRYRSSRSRQFFVERFGPQLGPMLWRVGRTGLLGRTWRNYAHSGEDALVAF